MLDIALKVFFVLIAIVMIVMILLQQGSGAQAGSGFGSGASGTVFGSQGSANFLSKSTRTLAIAFFALSLFMAWKASHDNKKAPAGTGVMTQEQGPQKQVPSGLPQIPSSIPTPGSAPAGQVPAPAVIPSGPATVPATPAPAPTTAPSVEPEKAVDPASKGG